MNEWILGRVSCTPADFAGGHDIITNLAKESEPGDIERTSFMQNVCVFVLYLQHGHHKNSLYSSILKFKTNANDQIRNIKRRKHNFTGVSK